MDLLENWGITVLSKSATEVILSMPITAIHKQPFGLVHGGVNATLIETACSIGANENLDTTKEIAVGVDIQTNHLKSSHTGTLLTHATANHIGNATQVWQASITNDQKKLVSVGRCTLLVKKK